MTDEGQIACVAAVMFFAALTRSTFGFGEALVAMPLLTLVLNEMKIATALVAISSIANSLLILATTREDTDWRSGWRLTLSTIAGIPVGVYVLTHVPESIVKGVLATLLIVFSLYSLRRPKFIQLSNDYWAFPFGFIGGILGGAYNTSGPPLVVYGSLRGWSPSQFRATLQGVFLPGATSVLIAHYSAGMWSAEVFRYLVWTLPLVGLSVPLGYLLNRLIRPEHFHRYLYVLLLILGAMLIWTVWNRSP